MQIIKIIYFHKKKLEFKLEFKTQIWTFHFLYAFWKEKKNKIHTKPTYIKVPTMY